MLAKLFIPLSFLLATFAAAQPEKISSPPDFSNGFKRLASLGLPPLDANATWSSLPEHLLGDDYEIRQLFSKMKGNGWSIPSTESTPLAVPAGKPTTLTLDASSTPNYSRRPPTKRPGSNKPIKVPTANLARDIAALIKVINKEKPSSDEFGYNPVSLGSGTILLLATQIHQTGQTELANQLATAIFDAFPSREMVIDSAISVLADHAYNTATQSFFQSGDWKTYHQSLTDITGKFPRGWQTRDAVAIFLPQLAKQAAGEKPPVPSIPGTPIDPRALAAIQALSAPPSGKPTGMNPKPGEMIIDGIDLSTVPVEVRSQLLSMQGGSSFASFSSCWLLQSPPETPNPSPLTQLTALGPAALPALAALADDPFLIHLPNPAGNSRSSYFSSNESMTDRITRIHASMNRPATRSEIARALLAATLPDPNNDLREADPDTLKETAIAFWKEHRESKPEQIALTFLRDGSSQQSNIACTILAKSSDPSAHQALETYILAADPAIAQFQNVQAYLTARKAAAKPFFDQYAKLVRSQTPEKSAGDDDDIYNVGDNHEIGWRLREAGGPAKILKQLESLVAGKSPRALAKEIAKGKPEDAATAIQSLNQVLESASPTKKLYAYLEGAVSAQDPDIRCQFLMAISQINWREADVPEVEPEPSDNVPKNRSMPQAEVNAWKKLIADARPTPEKYSHFTTTEITVGNLAEAAMISAIRPNYTFELYQAAPLLQKELVGLIREHAKAIIADKPTPALPDASKVEPQRLKSIITEAAAKPPLEVHPYLATLTPDERAAWAAWTTDPGEIPIPPSLQPLRFHIIGNSETTYLSTYFPDAKTSDLLAIKAHLTADTLLECIRTIPSDPDKHSRTFIQLHTANFGPGLERAAVIFPLPEPGKTGKEMPDPFDGPSAINLFQGLIPVLEQNPDASGILSLNLSAQPQERFTGQWLLKEGKLQPLEDDAEEKLKAFFKTLEDADGFPRSSMQLLFITKPDAEKLQESALQENDEEE